jgi:cephalosporin-C deacetylase
VAMFDLPLEELLEYSPSLPEPTDLDAFWKATLDDARSCPVDVRWDPVDTGLSCVQTWDVTFPGFGGHPVRGWLHLPLVRDRAGERGLPAVVQFLGYGGGRGLAHESMLWAVAGYAHLVMDTRGQGSGWSAGDTPDPVGSDPAHPGFMTRGVLDQNDYYYRRLFTDAVRAVDAVRSHRDVDPQRVAVTGSSQGGGLTLAVSALVPDVAAAMPDVPFLSHFRRAIEITDKDPYGEIRRYLKIHRGRVEQVLRTLSYFDVAVLARRAQAPALFSVALMDQTCPPSTVYAAYNAYAGPKAIVVYPYNDHEGGQAVQAAEQLRWLRGAIG